MLQAVPVPPNMGTALALSCQFPSRHPAKGKLRQHPKRCNQPQGKWCSSPGQGHCWGVTWLDMSWRSRERVTGCLWRGAQGNAPPSPCFGSCVHAPVHGS